jgi:uncharacterized protein
MGQEGPKIMNILQTINIHVIPNTKKEDVFIENKQLKIKVSTPPEKGKANKKVVQLLAKRLKIPKNRITIVQGEYSKHKIVTIEGLNKPVLDFFTPVKKP